MSRPPPQLVVGGALAQLRAAMSQAVDPPNIGPSQSPTGAPWSTMAVNLNDAAVKPLPGGVGLYLDPSSTPAGTELRVNLAGGVVVRMTPGCRVRARFPGGTVESWTGSGIAVLLVFQQPDADVAYFAAIASGSSRVSAAQAVGSAGNIPVAATEGIQVGATRFFAEARNVTVSAGALTVVLKAGPAGVRAYLLADSGQTITAVGAVVWWTYDDALGLWAEGPVQDTPPTGRRMVATTDQQVTA